MKKFFTSFAVVVLAVVSQACATGAGYTGFTGLSFPGYEAAGVVAGNQALSGPSSFSFVENLISK